MFHISQQQAFLVHHGRLVDPCLFRPRFSPIPQDYTEDPDEGNNSVNYFYMQTPFRITQPLETQLRQRGVDNVFRIGRQDGVIRTSTYFQADMQGRFEFVVMAKDASKGYQDSANVSVSFPFC